MKQPKEPFPFKPLHPWKGIPAGHVISMPVEIPVDWVSSRNLKPVDIRILLLIAACANPDMICQVSRKQIARTIKSNVHTVTAGLKRLKKHGYLEKIPTPNGFTPVWKLHPLPSKKRKSKSAKNQLS